MHPTPASYPCHLLSHLPPLLQDPDVRQRLLAFGPERLAALALLDLEPARALLLPGYCQRRGGRHHRDPVVMLRALVVMVFCDCPSINLFTRRLRGQPELRLLCGLPEGDRGPGVGTFYDFLHRLLDGPYHRPCEHRQRPSSRLRGRHFQRCLKIEKSDQKAQSQADLAHSQQGRVDSLVDKRLAAFDEPLPDDLTQRLNEILTRCGVLPSLHDGLLADIRRLVVCGDGTAIPSHAQGRGHALCSCAKDGKADCTCPRRYSDPEAHWGYDSHRERYYFGYRLHVLTTHAGADDLPLHIALDPGHTPDVIMGVDSLLRLCKQLKESATGAHISAGVFDAGYDATAYYRLNQSLDIAPIIPLAQISKTPACAQDLPRDETGAPLCAGQIPMRLHQRDLANRQLVYNCPAKRPGRANGKVLFRVHRDDCPNASLCEPESVMGPILHLRLDGDPRLNLPIPRNSPKFTELYRQRTSTERFNSTLKSKGDLANGAFRRRHVLFTFAVLHAVEIHARARAGRHLGSSDHITLELVVEHLKQRAAAQPS